MYFPRGPAAVATAIVALLMATVMVTGCRNNGPRSIAVTGSPGIGQGIETTGDTAAAWVHRWDTIAITVFGSSSCPHVPTHVLADPDRGVITVTISDKYKGPCTTDLAPYTSVIKFDQKMNGRHPIELVIREQGRPDVRLRL